MPSIPDTAFYLKAGTLLRFLYNTLLSCVQNFDLTWLCLFQGLFGQPDPFYRTSA